MFSKSFESSKFILSDQTSEHMVRGAARKLKCFTDSGQEDNRLSLKAYLFPGPLENNNVQFRSKEDGIQLTVKTFMYGEGNIF